MPATFGVRVLPPDSPPPPLYTTIPWDFGDVKYHKHDDISLVIVVSKELEAILDKYYIAESKRLNRWKCPRPFGQKVRNSNLDAHHLKQFKYVVSCRNKFAHERGEDTFRGNERQIFVDISRQLFLELYQKHGEVDKFYDCQALKRKSSLQLLESLIESNEAVKAMMILAEGVEYESYEFAELGLGYQLLFWAVTVVPICTIIALTRK